MSDVQFFIESALRSEINSLLSKFPEHQTLLFARVFPGGIDRLGEENLRHALALCYRTASKNEGKDFNAPRMTRSGTDVSTPRGSGK